MTTNKARHYIIICIKIFLYSKTAFYTKKIKISIIREQVE